MKMYIPRLGDQIRLTKAWDFALYNESRNMSLLEVLGDTRKQAYPWSHSPVEMTGVTATIPEGTILKIDRIYIRKGNEEFDSVSFTWPGMRTRTRIEERTVTNYTGSNTIETSVIKEKIPARPVRFWAKLDDVNKIEFEPV